MTEHEYEEWFNKYLGEVESLHSDSSKQGVLSFIPRKLHRWHWIVSCLFALTISTFLSVYLAYHYELSNHWVLSWSSNALLSFSIGLIASIFLMLYTNACNRNVGFYSVAIPLLEKRLSDMRKAYFDYTFKIQIRYAAEDYQGCYDAWHVNSNTCFVILDFLRFLKKGFPYTPKSFYITDEELSNAEKTLLEANNRIQKEFFNNKTITAETKDFCIRAVDCGMCGLNMLENLILELKLDLYGMQYGKHKKYFSHQSTSK